MQNVIEGNPLSIQQKQIWQSQPVDSVHTAQCVILIDGDVDTERLRAALGKAVSRHEMLRTSFCRRPGLKYPLQVVAEHGEFSWSEVDCGDGTADFEPERLKSIIRLERRTAFNLERTPLLKALLLTLSPNRRCLICTLPSLCADDNSLLNLAQEIELHYSEASADVGPDDFIQYIEFSDWQDDLVEGDEAAAGKAFWLNQQISFSSAQSLPLERRSEIETEFEPERFEVGLEQETQKRLIQAAKESCASPQTLLLACWKILLWRITSRQDIVIGHIANGRKYPEFESGIGPFARRLPISIRLEPEMTFNEAVNLADEAVRKSHQWQEYFSPEPDPQSAFSSFDFEWIEASADRCLGNHSFSTQWFLNYAERFKIRLRCIRRGEELSLSFIYDPVRIQEGYVRNLASCFSALASSAVDDPFREISRLNIVSMEDRRLLLADFNQTAADYPRGLCIHQLIEICARENPDRIAVVCDDRQISFARLNADANRLARLLRRWGVENEAAVGLCLDRSIEMVIGLLAVMKAGGAYVPLDPGLPKARLTSLLSEIQAPALITQEAAMNSVEGFQGRVVCIDRDRPLFESEPDGDLRLEIDPQQLCYVIYTSGSTGAPKGVAISHRNLVNYSAFILHRLAEAELASEGGLRFATISTLSADLGNTCLFPSLISAGCLHILSYERATNSDHFGKYLKERGVDVLKITPTHFGALISQEIDSAALPSVLVFGGERLSYDLAARIAGSNPRVRIINHYGPTETTVGALTHRAEDLKDSHSISVPIGRPIANAEAYLLDGELNPVPIGAAGELYLGGDGAARGYLRQAAHTAERFLPNPFNRKRGERLYKTGDLARRLPDGNIEFLGRVDHQVKIRGYRIELGEIESTIKRHPDAHDAVVATHVGREGREQLVAYVVASQETKAVSNELKVFLQERLPDYMIPSEYIFLKSFPLTTNGKIDRKALPNPEERRPETERKFIAPRTPAEAALAEIWSRTLGIPKISVDDNFFELGGDSIISIQIVAKANPLGFQLSPKQLFEHPTIASLAVATGASLTLEAEQGPVVGPAPLTPIQRWFFELNPTDWNHWNMGLLLEARQAIDSTVLARSLQKILDHHDALRMRFFREGAEWRQRCIAPGEPPPLTTIDLSALNESQQRIAIETSARQIQRSFHLIEGPIMRAALFEGGPSLSSRLLILIHHLVVDAVSLRILLEDLQTVYLQLREGKPARLPKKTTSFKQWGERLLQFAQSDEAKAESSYWFSKEWMGAAAAFQASVEENLACDSKSLSVSLSAEETRSLLREAPKAYQTQINDLLLAALAESVAWSTGDRRVVIDLEGHGREDLFEGIELSRTIGWFTTHYPVLLDVRDVFDAGAVIKKVKEQLRRIPQQGISYGALKYLRGGGDKPLTPLIGFNYLGQVDQSLNAQEFLKLAPENIGPLRSPRSQRGHLVEVVGVVADGRLQTTWNYHGRVFERAAVEQIAAEFLEALKRIIAHCRVYESGGYTPSDFPQAGLSQEALDLFLARL